MDILSPIGKGVENGENTWSDGQEVARQQDVLCLGPDYGQEPL